MVNGVVFGLYSPLPMSGKSTAAAALTGVGWKRLPFAGTLKRMVRVLLLDLGQSEEEVERALSSEKELPCVLLNHRTPRQLLQTLGTEWGRELVDEELWVKCWRGRVSEALCDGFCVVADYVRRWNEAKAVQQMGGAMVKVVRPGGGSDTFSDHASEGGLENWPFYHTIVNDGSIADLERQVLTLVQTLTGERDD